MQGVEVQQEPPAAAEAAEAAEAAVPGPEAAQEDADVSMPDSWRAGAAQQHMEADQAMLSPSGLPEPSVPPEEPDQETHPAEEPDQAPQPSDGPDQAMRTAAGPDQAMGGGEQGAASAAPAEAAEAAPAPLEPPSLPAARPAQQTEVQGPTDHDPSFTSEGARQRGPDEARQKGPEALAVGGGPVEMQLSNGRVGGGEGTPPERRATEPGCSPAAASPGLGSPVASKTPRVCHQHTLTENVRPFLHRDHRMLQVQLLVTSQDWDTTPQV